MFDGLQILSKYGKLAATLIAYNTSFWICLLFVTRHKEIDLTYTIIIAITLSMCATSCSFVSYVLTLKENTKREISDAFVIVGYFNTFIMSIIIALSFRYDTHFIFSLKIASVIYAGLLSVSYLVDVIKKGIKNG
jgi:hypothetical protein